MGKDTCMGMDMNAKHVKFVKYKVWGYNHDNRLPSTQELVQSPPLRV